jgi:hypothetical protein
MSGRLQNIQALVKKNLHRALVWTHCMIHRETLASKAMSLNIALTRVVIVVHYIKTRLLKSRIFSALCKAMGRFSVTILLQGKMSVLD